MDANTYHNYFSARGGGGSSLTSEHYSFSGHPEVPKAQQHIRAFWNFTGHPKALAEGSQKVNEMLKQVQHDKNTSPRPQGRGIKGEGQGCDKTVSEAHSKFLVPYCLSNLVSSKKVAFTLAEGATQRICTRTERSEFVPASKTTLLRAVHNPRHVDMFDNIRRAAFTLAEVLITLAIIGVVAAMTVPTLVANYREKVFVTKLKNTYSILNSAFDMAIKEYGPINFWGANNRYDIEPIYNKIMPQFLKILRTCEASNDEKIYTACWGKDYYKLDKSYLDHPGRMKKTFILNNGTSIKFLGSNGDNAAEVWCQAYKNSTEERELYFRNCGTVTVDLNGSASPNQIGKDVFKFDIYRDGILPQGMPNRTYTGSSFENACLNKTYTGINITCTAWVIYNGNMDYWDCDDLSWNGKHSCR